MLETFLTGILFEDDIVVRSDTPGDWGVFNDVTKLDLTSVFNNIRFGAMFLIPDESWIDKLKSIGWFVKPWQESGRFIVMAVKPDFIDEFNSWLQSGDEDCVEAACERVRGFLKRNPSITGSWADVGGRIASTKLLLSAGADDVTIFDINESNKINADKVKFVSAALGNLGDYHFDWIYCSHTLEHCPDLTNALKELHSIVSKGCWLVVPLHGLKANGFFKGHWSCNTDPDWWIEQVQSAGFEIAWFERAEQKCKPGLFQLFIEAVK